MCFLCILGILPGLLKLCQQTGQWHSSLICFLWYWHSIWSPVCDLSVTLLIQIHSYGLEKQWRLIKSLIPAFTWESQRKFQNPSFRWAQFWLISIQPRPFMKWALLSRFVMFSTCESVLNSFKAFLLMTSNSV